MKRLMTVLAMSTSLAAGGAMAQVAAEADVGAVGVDVGVGAGGVGAGVGGVGAGVGGGYGSGVGYGYGADLGYGYGYGAGLLGGSLDSNFYGVGFNDLYESEVTGAEGEEIGQIERVIRSCNVYASINVDAEWLEEQPREVLVPVSQMIVTNEGLIVQGLNQNTISNFPVYRAGLGLTPLRGGEAIDPVDTGVDPIDEGEIDPIDAGADPVDAGEVGAGVGYGAGTVGGLYGAQSGWSACQTGGLGGAGMGAGLGGGLGEEEEGEGLGAGVGVGGVGAGVGVGGGAGAGAGAGAGGGMLSMTVDALENADVYGPEGELIGEIDTLYRSQNLYAVLQIDTGWFSEGGTAIVPLQRFVRTEDGLYLPGVTSETIQQYGAYGGVYGDFWNAGYAEVDTDYYGTVGEYYGYGGVAE